MKKKCVKIISKHKSMLLLRKVTNCNSACYYLDQDFEYFIKLKDNARREIEIKNLSGLFQEIFEEIKGPFLKEIGRINRQENSIEWWGGQIASRNTATTPLSLNITYLFCIRRILSEAEGDLILITSSSALSNCIAGIANELGYNVLDYSGKFDKMVKNMEFFTIYFAKIFYLLCKIIKSHKAASGLPKLCPAKKTCTKKRIVMRSWVTAGSFDSSNKFKERNFGPLLEWLTDKNYEVWISPMFFNTGMGSGQMYALLKKQKQLFLIPEHYLKFSDYVKAFRESWRMTNKRLKSVEINGIDVTPIFNEAIKYSGLMRSSLMLNLCGPMLKRMKEAGYEIDSFYYPFENNASEKQFIVYCRKYFPRKAIIGFQHTAFFSNQLGCNLAPDEWQYHPLPDKIVCSGPIYPDLFKKAGFPEKILECGSNLRFENVYGNRAINHSDGGVIPSNEKKIVLLLTFSQDLALELFSKVKEAIKDDDEIKIYIRSHPLLSKKKLIDFMESISMKNYKFADAGIFQESILSTYAVVSMAGSVAILEAVTAGVPVIRVVPENTFYYDPFIWPEYPLKPINTASEVNDQIKLIGKILSDDQQKFNEIGKKVLKQYFTKPTDENMQVFL